MELETLKKDMQELIDWKNKMTSQQISYPLDIQSTKILREGSLTTLTIPYGALSYEKDSLITTIPMVATDLLGFGLIVNIDGINLSFTNQAGNKDNTSHFGLYATPVMRIFTANAGTDTITCSSGAHALKAGDVIALASSGTLPGGTSSVTLYYVINPTKSTFQISTTSGGSAVDITSAGTGVHVFAKPLV